MPRFFRRLSEGVFDQEDLALRTDQLAGLVQEATDRYGVDRADLVAVGFSNRANIAASLLLRHPRLGLGKRAGPGRLQIRCTNPDSVPADRPPLLLPEALWRPH